MTLVGREWMRNRGLMLVLLGGLANLFSRVAWGWVWDYIHFFGVWFNIADLLITVGVIFYILDEVGNNEKANE